MKNQNTTAAANAALNNHLQKAPSAHVLKFGLRYEMLDIMKYMLFTVVALAIGAAINFWQKDIRFLSKGSYVVKAKYSVGHHNRVLLLGSSGWQERDVTDDSLFNSMKTETFYTVE